MSFVTDADVKTYLKDLLVKGTTETLAAYWDSIVNIANSAAYRFIVQYWSSKGYSATQIADWDFAADFQKQLAGYLAVVRVYQMYPSDYSPSTLPVIDPRKDLIGDPSLGLDPQPMIIDGAFADPDGTRGSVSYGAFSTGEDLFVMDTDDTRIGEVTKL